MDLYNFAFGLGFESNFVQNMRGSYKYMRFHKFILSNIQHQALNLVARLKVYANACQNITEKNVNVESREPLVIGSPSK